MAAAMLLLVWPAAARALDDAGTQSLFAAGAGVRALAMSGAFVASGADASALSWNPAGLGFSQRMELQGAQSTGLALGFNEAYAAYVLPSWRLGSFGFSLHTFGVGGIEQRDERNALIDADLSDRELEMSFGYGRALSPAFSLGAAMKLRRQSLAGRSGGGLGVDLGAILRPGLAMGSTAEWASRLSAGFTLRNAVRPAIRLDLESVSDPTVTAAGFAYEFPLGALGSASTEADLEFVPGRGARPRIGAELRPLGGVALRAGFADAGASAGAGFRWRDITVDYAFHDGLLTTTHRAGVTLHFGATVSDSRLAAERAEDEAVQRRVGETFRLRQEQTVRELRAEADAALMAGDSERAIEAVTRWATLAPGDSSSVQYTVRALLARAAALESAGDVSSAELAYQKALATAPSDQTAAAGRDRCRAERERHAQRNDAVRQQFTRAMDALAAEDLVAARRGFMQVLADQPKDSEAAAMLRRTERMIGTRVGRRLEQASRFIAGGLLRDAGTALDEVRVLDPQAAGLESAVAALARARAAAEPARATRSSTAPVTVGGPSDAGTARPAMDDRQAEDLYRRGLESYRASRVEDAVRFWELVWSARGNYRGVGELLKREYLARGMDAYATGRLEEAASQWSRVLRIDPADSRARGYLTRAQQQLTRSQEILGDSQ